MNIPPGFLENDYDATIRYFIANDYMDMRLDDDGEPVFNYNENMKRDYPEFYEHLMAEQMREIDEALAGLIEAGLIEAKGMNAEGEMTFGLTPAGEVYARGLKGLDAE